MRPSWVPGVETPMVLYRVRGEDFHRLLVEVPYVARNVLRGIARRMRALEKSPTV